MAWTADASGSVNYYNQRWYDYTGKTAAETLEWGWKQIIHPDLIDDIIKFWIKAVTTGIPYEQETLFNRASDNTYRWHLVRARPIKNDDGDIVYG